MNKLHDILSRVQKPARYIGGEINSSGKTFSEEKVTFALAYPDLYEIGMSYLGLKIIYHLLNEMDDCVCERVFALWEDMENELLSSRMKLFSLGSKTEINKFDILGFSLSYELTFTGALNMLHLSGITLRAEDRKEDEPFVIAGGACCYNPEPMAEFIDLFIVGDAEEIMPRFIREYKVLKKKKMARKKKLKILSRLPGVYVPSLYEAEYLDDDFLRLAPKDEDAPLKVKKVYVEDLDKTYYPERQIVPFINIVHDRIAVEIMRGCPNSCRFCQASAVNRPVRLRSRETIKNICENTYRHTGYEQISLLSLSSVNYPHLEGLVRDLTEIFKEKGVGLSIPSLRVDESFYRLPEMISTIRKAGLTFAPESADEVIRNSIGKNIDNEILCKSARLAFEHGWRKLKLYFMVGFPLDEKDEAEKILILAKKLSNMKRDVSKGSAEINLSVNPFVPKPHTPFQWLGMQPREVLKRKKRMLLEGAGKKIKMAFHDIDRSILEGCLSRGDRRLSKVIYAAWKKGARLEGWNEFFKFSVWEESFKENDLNIDEISTRSFSPNDPLPWGHIDTGSNGRYLEKEFEKSGLQ